MTRDSLLDSSVLIDLLDPETDWFAWAVERTRSAQSEGRLLVNQVVISEVAARYPSLAALDAAISPEEFERESLPWEAAFVAGRAFTQYRRRGGPRTSLLPDFLIGAHATVMGYRLITRDPRRFRTYFPTLEIVAPDGS